MLVWLYFCSRCLQPLYRSDVIVCTDHMVEARNYLKTLYYFFQIWTGVVRLQHTMYAYTICVHVHI
jgi:hypothetical protein